MKIQRFLMIFLAFSLPAWSFDQSIIDVAERFAKAVTPIVERHIGSDGSFDDDGYTRAQEETAPIVKQFVIARNPDFSTFCDPEWWQKMRNDKYEPNSVLPEVLRGNAIEDFDDFMLQVTVQLGIMSREKYGSVHDKPFLLWGTFPADRELVNEVVLKISAFKKQQR